MSSVLLYLAIVVMWLCVLVPMWLRRDRAAFTELTEDAEPYVQDEEELPSEDSVETQRDIVLPSAPSAPVVRENLDRPSDPRPAESSGSRQAGASDRPAAASSGFRETSSEASAPRGTPAPSTRPLRRSATERRRAELRGRARRVAKRRRLTLWCFLLVVASTVTASVQVIPWWGVAPSVTLLGLYLVVLRSAVRLDAQRRQAAAQARAERARRARRRAELETRRPAAEIIDLSAHRDEIFDQYAEPNRRAVGD
ncbi:divisome protein SepX/GlpR [Streptosporangium jomthongense]|uniref:Transmembrane protein n=1 Tax=Streptosporangium jomthongense TaxID=1193683 RepID=A0ABV8FDB0_9ACTN